MDSIFIEPASLPGGRVWSEACQDVRANVNATAVGKQQILEALHCNISPSSGLIQVLLLLCVYGGILYKASELIAEGSELLLLVPSLRGIVGSVVLPILGAVPDGAIVLFSGLGSHAQEELSVGVGALAGSTIMLLTVPWALSIIAGRVNIRNDGVLTYHHRPHKLTPPGNWHPTRTGVGPLPVVKRTGQVMLLTAVSYLVIQAAAFSTGTFFKAEETESVTEAAARAEKWPATFCFFVCFAFFVWYLYTQMTASEEEQLNMQAIVDEVKQKSIREGTLSLTAAFKEIWSVVEDVDESTGLTGNGHNQERLAAVLRTFFNSYDLDQDRSINSLELQYLMGDLGEKCTAEEIKQMYADMDRNNDGQITLDEFTEQMPKFIVSRARARRIEANGVAGGGGLEEGNRIESYDAEGAEEEEEVPHDLRDDNPDKQIRKVMQRSFTMMGVGTALVLIFSDPMVGVMSDVGQRIGVPPFYVSFVLAPLASNASELLAAYTYAAKKTRRTVTISFSTLLGAAIMNNTFVLSIFMLLITLKGLAWQFTAETMSILFVELVMGYMSQKGVLKLQDGYFVLSLFPLSIALVFFLENVVGLD